MTADTLRRLQALRGLTRTGSTHTVLAQVQGDLQTVIEAVLDLAGEDDESATDEPAAGEQVTDRIDVVWQRFEDGWHWLAENYPDAEFTPIPTLADDEVAVKREVVVMAAMRLEHARRDMLDYGRTATATALQHAIGALTDALVAGEDA